MAMPEESVERQFACKVLKLIQGKVPDLLFVELLSTDDDSTEDDLRLTNQLFQLLALLEEESDA